MAIIPKVDPKTGKISIEREPFIPISWSTCITPGDFFSKTLIEKGKNDPHVVEALRIFGKEKCKKWFIEYCELNNIAVPAGLREKEK